MPISFGLVDKSHRFERGERLAQSVCAECFCLFFLTRTRCVHSLRARTVAFAPFRLATARHGARHGWIFILCSPRAVTLFV